MTTAGTKKIFISDIHLGDVRSQAGVHPYGWFRNNIHNLANFLTARLNDPGVAEVVIVGDLFDEWVIPTDQDPLVSFEAVCRNPANAPVITALQQWAARGALTYVPGNHDMSMSSGDPAGPQKFKESFPGVRFPADGVYRSGRLVAEHGNRYCLFNSSDTFTNPPSLLPLGYFISRLVAYKVSQTGTNEDFHDIVERLVRQMQNDPNFIRSLFVAVAQDAGLSETSPVDTTGLAGFPANVGDLGTLYGLLIDNWKQNRTDIDWKMALMGDGFGNLSPAADWIYFSFLSSDQDIVIFGHTHKADLKKHYLLAMAPEVKDIHLDLPCRAIYANSGTWVDTAALSCTYVETEMDADAGRHYVRVKAYPDQTLQEGFVKL